MAKRINRVIELLEQGQPLYNAGTHDLSYENGKAMASTWADYIGVEMEHGSFDMSALDEFMRGLVDGGTDAERTSDAAGYHDDTDGRHERGSGARQRVDDEAVPCAGHSRHSAVPCGDARRGFCIRGVVPVSVPDDRRGRRRAGRRTQRRRRAARRGAYMGRRSRRVHEDCGPLAAQP